MNTLERLERELLEALGRGDLNAVGRLLREDFLITTAGWIAEPVGKQAWLDELARRMTPLRSFDLRLIAAREFGPVAVAIAESAQEGIHDEKPFSLTFRYTDVWVRDGTDWALATRHASIVPRQ